jgi:hypothetical protein
MNYFQKNFYIFQFHLFYLLAIPNNFEQFYQNFLHFERIYPHGISINNIHLMKLSIKYNIRDGKLSFMFFMRITCCNLE